MSLERQIKTSPGRSNWVFRGRPRDVGGAYPGTLKRDVLGTSWETIFEAGKLEEKYFTLLIEMLKVIINIWKIIIKIRNYHY